MPRLSTACAMAAMALSIAGCSAPSSEGGSEGPVAYLDNVSAPPEQCSRTAVSPGDRYFRPSSTEIAYFESQALKALQQRRDEGGNLYFEDILPIAPARAGEDFPRRWDRAYMGIERHGRRYIYGDYGPLKPEGSNGQSQSGVWGEVVCDGGRAFFGAEMDINTGQFRFVGFNGPSVPIGMRLR